MRKYLKILSLASALLTSNFLLGSIVIESDEGIVEKGTSTFSGHVSIKCGDEFSIFCDVLQRQKNGYKLTDIKIENATIFISSNEAFFDERLEKGKFIENVLFKMNDLLMTASEADCLLEKSRPQIVNLYSDKKEGCSLKSDIVQELVFQRVNFDVCENQALFFFPRGKILWKDKIVDFSSNMMKVEPGRLVLDGKIFIQIGKAIYNGNGPFVLHFDPQEKILDKCFAEGKSTLIWDDYVFNLDGSFQYDSKIHKMFFKTPRADGLNFKYPMGEVFARYGEITLNTENVTVEEINLNQDVFATYGVPTVQFLLADSITIWPLQHLAVLQSKDRGKVLLYDQVNKLEMSSNRVNIEWGETLGSERIEGVGDVRFSFDQREKGIIDALFRSR